MRKQRNPELFWNAETLSRALDVDLDKIMLFTRLGLIPDGVRVHDVLLWRAVDIRAWAKAARAATPAEAVATLWNAWQQHNDIRKNKRPDADTLCFDKDACCSNCVWRRKEFCALNTCRVSLEGWCDDHEYRRF